MTISNEHARDGYSEISFLSLNAFTPWEKINLVSFTRIEHLYLWFHPSYNEVWD